jgi:glyoxylase-like metal-dependent hydrolase (beta-lactamase superfamily II)
MILERIVVGPMQVNCYILGCSRTLLAFVIDPGAEPEKISSRLNIHKLKVQCIINTHGHADHIGANTALAAPVFIHRLDAQFLISPQLNLSNMFGFCVTSVRATKLLEDGQEVTAGDVSLQVIHTPGHTPGGICLNAGKFIFTGDTIFAQGVGRTDFPYASERDLMKSIQKKLFTLEDRVVIYPGHGPSSTIGEEKKNFS